MGCQKSTMIYQNKRDKENKNEFQKSEMEYVKTEVDITNFRLDILI